jgi:hypothetical protein
MNITICVRLIKTEMDLKLFVAISIYCCLLFGQIYTQKSLALVLYRKYNPSGFVCMT